MNCPRCMKDNVTPIGDSHYVCNNQNCMDDAGNRTQFQLIPDDYIRFPDNQIYVNRDKHEFYQKPYLTIDPVGMQPE